MLSKKMAFLLMCLIAIFVLALVVPSAMAGEFGVSLDMSSDVSHVSGLQLPDASTIALIVKFDEAVVLATEDISVSNYDEAGNFLPVSTAPTISPSTAAKQFTITITPANGATRLAVRTRKGIVSADVLNDDTSGEGKWDINLLGGNPQGGPDVLKIVLVGEPFATITTATFQIHVLLSEEPKDGFNKDLLEVTGATVSSVVKLASPGSSATVNGTTVSASWRDNTLHLYLVTLETQRGEKTVTIKVKDFAGMEKPTDTNTQYVRQPDAALTEGRDTLTVKTDADGLRTRVITVYLPENTILPEDADAITTIEKQKVDTTAADATETAAAEKVKADAAIAAAKAVDTSVSIPKAGQIYISEIMFAGGGTLPQWIEISNGSKTEEVNLSGWTLTVENATADADVSVGASAVFTIPEGTRIDPSGQHDTPSTVLVVTEQGRNNLTGAMADGQVVNLWTDQQLELFRLDIFKRRYSLLSDMAFKITLAPPAALITTPAADATDVVGNLGADGTATWALPMAEGNARSSIIRRHVADSVGPAEPKAGEMLESWVLASDTNFGKPMHLSAHSYYGLPIDVGTPGFRAGGALPVELSHFRPERQKDTRAVVITWSTQSELNNAGFFVKRSQQRDGQFKVINATMIPGAGTTSEKQFYTYTDTTAQANVVYYYQIEDVSLDGNRQTLTRGIRLKGYMGAAGKVTTLWGELKRTN